MTGIIFSRYKNKHKAYDILQDIEQKYNLYSKVKTIVKTKETIYFKNGDVWKIIFISENNCRGCAANIAYIDKTIPQEEQNILIFPCLKSYPYIAYNYF